MKDPDATASVDIYLDPATAHAHKAQRLRRHNIVAIPALRLLGFMLVAAVLLVHNALVLGSVNWPQYIGYVAATMTYAVASWLVLAQFYRPFARVDLALVFLITDIVFWAVAVYVSGAERSWMFFIVLVHVLDQGATTVRSVRLFAHLGVVAYVAVMAWVYFIDGRGLDWGAAIAKTAILYTFGLYGALTAVPAEALRRRLSSAIRVARGSIADLAEQRRQLEEKSAQLEEAKRQAEEASEAKTDFLARVSHEMRTPLNAILGYAQVLDTDRLAPQQRAHVREILDAGAQLLALVNVVLEIDEPVPAAAARANAMPANVPASSTASPPYVLCVEDNPSNARLVEILLGRRLGMRVTFAATSALALELARSEPPDLILLDLNLPDGSGLDVLRALRADARTRTVKVLVVSADAIPEHIQALIEAGADAYVTKPYDVNHFVDVVRACLPATRDDAVRTADASAQVR